MREKHLVFFGAEVLTLIVCLYLMWSGRDSAFLIILGLSLICLVAGKLLVQQFRRSQKLWPVMTVLPALVCIVVDYSGFFPLLALLITELADHAVGRRYAYPLTTVVLLLFWLLFPASDILTIIAILAACAIFAMLFLLFRLDSYKEQLESERAEADHLRRKLSDNRQLASTLQYTARLEERNRLAARIHDKIGHGVSGSIILLEGALLQMDQKPDSARSTIEQAISSLRTSVDDIRISLRQEHAPHSELGVSEISASLAQFSSTHKIKTEFTKSGPVDKIPAVVWRCVHDNLTEALTNCLKHAAATHFLVRMFVTNKIIRVEFRDNGGAGSFKKGMGLEAMEERVLSTGGRCFFHGNAAGFAIVQVFIMP